MEILIGVLVVVVVVAVVWVVLQRFKPSPRPPDEPEPEAPGEVRVRDGKATVALDIAQAEPDNPVVQRLVHDAAAQVFNSHSEVQEVTVTTAAGAVLGTLPRAVMTELETGTSSPVTDPRARHRTGPGVGAEAGPSAQVAYKPGDEPAARALADRFDLPPAVRAKLRDPDDVKELVRALLEAAGVEFTLDSDVFKVGREAIVIVDIELGRVVPDEQLNNAFLRFQRSGARSGVVVSPGLMYPQDLQRRHAMAPSLKHAGPEGIQRMADAVALGANPLRFVTGPVGS